MVSEPGEDRTRRGARDEPLSPATWRRARELFERVVELPFEERPGVLGLYDPDDVVRREVERLLAVEETEDDFLRAPHEAAPAPLPGGLVGRTVGPFAVERVIAAGGMATVYEARQDEPRRRVALKVMSRGPGDDEARRRFRYEAELLGHLHHPCIAQVYDAGVFELDGFATPWFALELIEDARSLTAFADERGLDLRARIELFQSVLEAVQHGHQRGVVHRDLKPGNVLVDPEGRVRVIDFGVARWIGDDGPSAGDERTRAGDVIGTLRYMSPEQLLGRSAEVDARADVWALGVLLYELICGRPPFDSTGRSLPELARLVSETEPERPSSIAPELPIDLDWVTARAMEKDPDRRYASASDLAADLARFLANEPVAASPPSTTYQLRKFVARHRFGVAAAAAVVAALVVGWIGTWLGLQSAVEAEQLAQRERSAAVEAEARARAERREAVAARAEAQAERAEALDQAARAEEMLAFLLEALEAPAPRQQGRDVTMRTFLDRASDRIEASFVDRPRLAGWMHLAVGRAYHGLGANDEAERHLRASVEARRRVEPIDPVELSESLADLALIEREALRVERSRELLDEARALLTDHVAPADPALLRLEAKEAQHRIATASASPDELGALVRALEQGLGPDDPATLGMHHELARLLHEAGHVDEAETHYRVALAGWIARAGPDHPEVLRARGSLVVLLFSSGRTDDARAELEELLDVSRRVLGPDHPDTISALNNLASIHYLEGRYEEAAPLFREALELLEEQVPDDHPMLQLVRANLGTIAVTLGWLDEAEPLIRTTYETRLATLGPAHDDTLRMLYELARIDFQRGRHADALARFEQGLETLEASYGRGHPRYARFELEAACSLIELGRLDEARARIDRMLRAYEAGERSSEIIDAADVRALAATLDAR